MPPKTKNIQHEPPEPQETHHAPELERSFLRRGVEGMAAKRHFCSGCGRSPVVGERLHSFEGQAGEVSLCDICVSQADLETLGKHLGSRRVRASERRLKIVGTRAA